MSRARLGMVVPFTTVTVTSEGLIVGVLLTLPSGFVDDVSFLAVGVPALELAASRRCPSP